MAADIIYDVMGTAAIHIAAHRISIVPESSLAKDWCCICGPVLTVTSKVTSAVFNDVLFLGSFLRARLLQVVSLTPSSVLPDDRHLR